jgi:DNA adenine methylase
VFILKQFISVSEAAVKWGISHRRVQILCAQERIEGAMRVGTVWVIPAGAEKPQDPRKQKKK